MQTALPCAAPGHGVHDAPHEFTELSDTHALPQRCEPFAQAQVPLLLQTALPSAAPGHAVHDEPHESTELLARH